MTFIKHLSIQLSHLVRGTSMVHKILNDLGSPRLVSLFHYVVA